MSVELTLLPAVRHRGREITSPRLRSLLALLAGDLRSGCSRARLVAGLWPDERPENPPKALHVLVARARAQLGAEVITSTPAGYRLSLPEDQVDASAILLDSSACARCSHAGDHAAALAHAEAGIALWGGAPDGDGVPDDPVSALRTERASTHQALLRARAMALSRLGRHAEAVEELTGMAARHPRDEEVLLELLRSEAATAGPAAALCRYETYRRALRDELGVDPGPALQAAHQQLLREQAPVVRSGVPHEPNPLLGRAGDITAVANLLRTSRVTSIVGVGGLGKTRLAHVVSRDAEQRVVHSVPLAGVTSDDGVASEVASSLGVPGARRGGSFRAPRDVVHGIVDALAGGPALLVLDNCEHVARGVAELVQALVSLTRELRVLTTSRAPLGLSSESVYPLPELDLATTVELFEQRARAARPDVDLPADAVRDLCRRLDGLPLAVELAAARVRAMSVAEIACRLDDRFAVLRGGSRDAPPRHQALHATLGWSWNLLGPAGQTAMRALSIFPDGFSADAARALLGDGDISRILEHLVGQSLLKVIDTPSGSRFRMLETVREFSTARRAAAGETEKVTADFLAWARDFGMAHHSSVFEAGPLPAARRIGAERDNLAHALRLGLDAGDGAEVAAASAVLSALWTVECNYPRLALLTEETAWMLSHYHPEPEFVEVTRTASALCTMYTFMIRGLHAVRSLVTLRRLPSAPPDTLVRAIAVALCAAPEYLGSDRSALCALCDSTEPLLAGVANGIASYAWEHEGDLDSSLKSAERMLDALDGGSAFLRVHAHARVGELCSYLERGDEARRHWEIALRTLDELGSSDVVGIRSAIVLANLQLGAVDEAERWCARASVDWTDDPMGALVLDLGSRAEILLARGEVDAGLRLWRRAVDQLTNAEHPVYRLEPSGMEPETVVTKAIAVVAHAQYGRLDLVPATAGELPHMLSAMLENPTTKPPACLVEHPICGTLLLALGMTDLDRGARTEDERATRSGVHLIALAERFQFLKMFQPTMSSARARHAAEYADRSAYADAVSGYADLDRDGLCAAALAALRARREGDSWRGQYPAAVAASNETGASR